MKAPILREQRQMASVAGKVPSEFNGLQTNFLRNEQELFSPNREFSRQMTIQIAILFRSGIIALILNFTAALISWPRVFSVLLHTKP